MKTITLSTLIPTTIFFACVIGAQALTISATTMYDAGSGLEVAHAGVGTMSTDKASYAAGETITITTSGSISYDAGALPGYGAFTSQQMNSGCACGVPPYLGYLDSGDIANGSMLYNIPANDVYFPIPSGTSPGSYNLDVRTAIFSKNASLVQYASDFNYALLPYTVAAPSVDVNLCFDGPCP